jgi:hypothetical protein
MALRIGKKNNDNDWSEESLRQELAQISGQTDEAAPAHPAATDSDDPLADLLADMPAPDSAATVPGASASTPPAATAAAPMEEASIAGAAPRRPGASPILLAGGLVFLIVAVAVGAWLAFFSAPVEDTSTPVAPVAQRPPRPVAPPPATKVIETRPKVVGAKPLPKTKVVPPRTPVTRVAPGKAGIAPKAATPPAIAPRKPGQAPRVEPVKGVPTPVVPPPGMAGLPGKGSTATTTVQIVRPASAASPALARQLKALWNQGAAAKHRGDYAGARRAWTKMLQLHPGHAGVQDAINKLPR